MSGEGHEWDRVRRPRSARRPTSRLFSTACRLRSGGERHLKRPRIAVPDELSVTIQPEMSTQLGFGALLNEIAPRRRRRSRRASSPTSPDVTVSTNLGPWVNRRGLFAREALADTFKSERIPSTFNWEFSPKGQHIELGIAEMNLFIALSALGLSHAINGERLLPIGTLYDPFIARGLDALNYACYQDARFILVATPSGITLAPEGGAHQSIAEPLIGMAQDGLAALRAGLCRRACRDPRLRARLHPAEAATAELSERNWLRDETGGSIYLRLSTRPIEQIQRDMTPELRQAIVDGAYWLREPGPNCQVVVAYTGAVAPEAIRAVGLMAEDRRDVGLLAVTSADRLNAGWTAALPRARARPGSRPFAYRAAVRRPAAALRHRQRARRPPGDAGVARRGQRPSRAAARRRAFRPDRLDRRPLPALRHRRQRHHRRGAGDRAGPADPVSGAADLCCHRERASNPTGIWIAVLDSRLRNDSLTRDNMPIIDAQLHAYERDHPGRPWHAVLTGPPEVTGEQTVAVLDEAGVDGAILMSAFTMYRYDASYAVAVRNRYPDRFALVKPVDPANPAVADVIADWKRTPGAVGVRMLLVRSGLPRTPPIRASTACSRRPRACRCRSTCTSPGGSTRASN